MTLDNILEEIKKAEKIAILTHETPDGDAIGSSLAFKLAIKQLGKEADVIIPKYSRTFEFLPGAKEIKTDSEIKRYDLAISVDCSDLKRLAKGEEYFVTAKTKIQVDHHSINTMFADYNFVNPVAPACCEILIGMFEYFGIEITPELGTCIITGIITDTGGFQYAGVTDATFELAAELLRKGINVSELYRRVLKIKTKPSFKLMKLAISRMEMFEEEKIAFTYLNDEDEKNVNAEIGDHEGIVDIGRDIEGVQVSIFIREREDLKGYKVSLRSNGDINVADLCFLLGGGGHKNAAGCTILGDIETVKNKILTEVRKVLK